MRKTCPICRARFEAERGDALTCSDRCRMRHHRKVEANTPPMPTERDVRLFMVDIPLRFVAWSAKGEGRSPQQHYPTMEARPLIRLLRPLFDLVAAKDCVVCWWVYGPRLPDSLEVLRGCGFEFTTELLTWRKTGKKTGKPVIGNGKSTRKQVENAWGGKRGHGVEIRDHAVGQLIEAPRGEHSAKPDAAYEALERLYGDVRRMNIFARRRRPGWFAWGRDLPIGE
jgi:N6-adenosine-specific RNA methylase IME4